MVDESKIAKLVEQELKKVLAGTNPASSSLSPSPVTTTGRNILVVYTGTEVGLNESAEQVKQLREKGFGLNLALSRQAAQHPGKNKIIELTGVTSVVHESEGEGIIKLLNGHVGVMICTLSRNTALKLSYGITDSFISYLIYLALISKKAVVAAKNGVDPAEGEYLKWNLPSLPNDLITLILGQVQKLERWGMRLVDVNLLAMETDKAIKIATGTTEKIDEMTPFGMDRPLVTERDVKEAAKSGVKKITLKPGTIITPLARDIANQLGIIIE